MAKKLSLEQISTIRELINAKKNTQKSIASMFSVSQQAISNLKTGKSWKVM